MSHTAQSSDGAVIPVLVVDHHPERLGQIACALNDPNGSAAPYSIWCFTHVEDVLDNPPHRGPVVFVTSTGADVLASLDMGPVVELDENFDGLRDQVTQALRAYITEKPDCINGRVVAWWRHDLACRAQQLGRAFDKASELVHDMALQFGEPLKLMQQFSQVLTDRMDHSPCGAQRESIGRLEHAVTALEEATVQLLPTDQRPAQQPEPKPALELLDVPLTVTRRAEALQDPKFVILPSRSTQPILTPGPSTVGDYMQRIGRLRQPPAILSLVRFTLCDPTCPLADLDRFLRPSNGPADLLIDVGDDCSLIALRAIDDPSPWIEKVQGAWWAAVLRGSTRPGTAFEAEWLGSWPWPPSEELLMLLGANRDFARAA